MSTHATEDTARATGTDTATTFRLTDVSATGGGCCGGQGCGCA